MNACTTPRSPLWLVVPPVLVMLAVWTNGDFPLDYWLHVNSGRWMAETGRLVTTDSFSHTIDGQPVLNQPWLAQWIMYRLHELGGYALNQFVAGIGYAVGLFGVTWLAWRRCANSTVAGLLGVLALVAMATNVGVRPQWFSVVLFAAELAWLARAHSSWIAAAGVFAIVGLWSNLHGAYPLGVVVPGMMAAAALVATDRDGKWPRFKRYAAATVGAALGALVRPDPQNAAAYVLGVSSKSVARGLEEWLPPAVDRNVGVLFFVTVAATLVVLGLARRRLSLGELALIVVFFVPAIESQRMVIWWGMILPMALARPAANAWKRFVPTRGGARSVVASTGGARTSRQATVMGLDWVMASLLVALLAASTPWTRAANPLLPLAKRGDRPAEEPWELVENLAKTTSEPVRSFAPLRWATYLTWHSRGRVKSFIDSRVDFFPDSVWSDYQRIAAGEPTALGLLDDYGVDLVVCDSLHVRLSATLRADTRWRVVYDDSKAQAFCRGDMN